MSPTIGRSSSAIALLAGLAAGPATADAIRQDRLITARETVLFRYENRSLVAFRRAAALTAFPRDGTVPRLADAAGTRYLPLIVAPGTRAWIREGDVVAPAEAGGGQQAPPPPRPRPAPDRVPELIAKQPETIRRAWREIGAVMAENERRQRPLPQPYLARAEIWAMAGDHEHAVEDLLAATSLIRRNGASLVEQSRYLDRLRDALEKLSRAPRPEYRGDALTQFTAGLDHYFRDDLSGALAFFDGAVQLAPEDKVSWYYRALTHKRLGHEAEAARDVTVAVSLEKRELEWPAAAKDRWLESFTRIQGPLRQWMESYRSGMPLDHAPSGRSSLGG
jgi:tetratricopeptide (TPR) repeat protein